MRCDNVKHVESRKGFSGCRKHLSHFSHSNFLGVGLVSARRLALALPIARRNMLFARNPNEVGGHHQIISLRLAAARRGADMGLAVLQIGSWELLGARVWLADWEARGAGGGA